MKNTRSGHILNPVVVYSDTSEDEGKEGGQSKSKAPLSTTGLQNNKSTPALATVPQIGHKRPGSFSAYYAGKHIFILVWKLFYLSLALSVCIRMSGARISIVYQRSKSRAMFFNNISNYHFV